MRRTTALSVTVLALCAVLLNGCRHGIDREAKSNDPGAAQTTGGPQAGTGNTGGTDPATVSTEVGTDLDQIDALLKELDDQQTKANQPFPDAD